MLDRQRASDLSDFLVRGFSAHEVVYAEHHAQHIARPFGTHAHGGPEAGVQGRGNPCCAEVGPVVEVCEGLGALEAHELGEVAEDVEIETCEDDGLPGCEALGEETGEAADYGRTVEVRSTKELSGYMMDEWGSKHEPRKVERPEKDDNKDLVFAELDGWSAEDMV